MRKVGIGLVAVVLAAAGIVTVAGRPAAPDTKALLASASGYDARILRDTWGVPHIFGRTDADVAYGLAYAHAEDDFRTTQGALLAARGKLASVFGRQAAPNDYMVHLLRVWDTVDAEYATALSPETRAICEGYAAGLNHYAALHPTEVLPGLFPARGEDVVAGFVHKLPLFFGLDNTLKELYEPARQRTVSLGPAETAFLASDTPPVPVGSNCFAVGPSRSADGKTRLNVNSHQPYTGPVAWYEVHLHSDEGWDMVGGVFPGAPVVLHGHNRHLGWAHTVNSPDLIDVYVLETDPENPNRYRFDGAWYDLEVRTARIRVKLWGPFSWTFKREVLWSPHHGPVVRRPHGTYAIRYAGMNEAGHIEQWYRMNRATTLAEWRAAMEPRAILMFNTAYADGAGNIGYVYNGRLPIRAEGYDWQQYVPGDRSENVWSTFLPFDRLPQVWNPASGFVQNCNSSPFQTTLGPENPREEDYSPTFGIETRMTNRALRARELFDADDSITAEEFVEYKYDMRYSTQSEAAAVVQEVLAASPSDDPVVREAVDVLRQWDLSTDPENTSAAIGVLTAQPVVTARIFKRDPPDTLQTFRETAHLLKRAYGRIDVPWQEVNRLRRGDVDLGIGGGPDILHAVYGGEPEDGKLTAQAGDTLVILVEWGEDGVHSQTIHQFGSATLDATSPHYADQVPLFVKRQLKPVWMDEADIRAHLEREYHPGG